MEGDTPTRAEFEDLNARLKRTIELAEENNQLLKNMRKWGRVAFWFKVLIWTVVLVAPIFLIPYLVPYIPALAQVPGLSSTGSSTQSSLFGVPSPSEVQAFLHPSK